MFHEIMPKTISHRRKNRAWANAWGSNFVRVGIAECMDLEKWEPGAWKMEPGTQHPETRAAPGT